MKSIFFLIVSAMLISSAFANEHKVTPIPAGSWGPNNEFTSTIDFKGKSYNVTQLIQCDDFVLKKAKVTIMGNIDRDFSLMIDHNLKVKAISPIKVNGKDATLIEIKDFGNGGKMIFEQTVMPGNKAVIYFENAC